MTRRLLLALMLGLLGLQSCADQPDKKDCHEQGGYIVCSEGGPGAK